MPLWGNTDSAANAPKFRVTDKFVSGTTATGAANAYANLTISGGQVVTVAGVDATEAAVLGGTIAHPGWVVVRQGTGPVGAVGIDDGGTGYTNGDVVVVSNGESNAEFTVGTDASGVITGLTAVSYGAGFINAAAIAVAVANSTGGSSGGSDAAFTVTLGGRAGRKHTETLVAMGSLTGDGSDDALFPDS